MLSEMAGVRGSVDSMQVSVREVKSELGKLRSDLDKVQADMCTKEQFDSLEARVCKLETQGVTDHQSDFLRQSLARLDPANRSCCVAGFVESNIVARMTCIDKLLADYGGGVERIGVETIFKGRAGERIPTPISIIEFKTRVDREKFLTAAKATNQALTDGRGGSLRIDRAKTQVQLARNNNMKKAKDLVQSHSAATGRAATIDWQKTVDGRITKDRTVEIGGQIAFTQGPKDLQGVFHAPFASIRI